MRLVGEHLGVGVVLGRLPDLAQVLKVSRIICFSDSAPSCPRFSYIVLEAPASGQLTLADGTTVSTCISNVVAMPLPLLLSFASSSVAGVAP